MARAWQQPSCSALRRCRARHNLLLYHLKCKLAWESGVFYVGTALLQHAVQNLLHAQICLAALKRPTCQQCYASGRFKGHAQALLEGQVLAQELSTSYC